MAGADLPALNIRSVRHHPVPPQQKDLVRLIIEHAFLEIAHQRALLREVRLVQHPVVESQPLLVLELSVVRGIIR